MILTRNAAIPVLSAVVVAPISRTVREIASEVPLGQEEGLPEECAANCDTVVTIPKGSLEEKPIGEMGVDKVPRLDQALRFALDINF